MKAAYVHNPFRFLELTDNPIRSDVPLEREENANSLLFMLNGLRNLLKTLLLLHSFVLRSRR